MKIFLLSLFMTPLAHAQLSVTVSAPKPSGQKAVVKLDLVNRLNQPVESARAAIFLSDENGQVVARGTRWVIGGGDTNRPPLAVGATNTFHFVVNADQPFLSTNLTPKVIFSRLVLPHGHTADPVKDVSITLP